MSDEKNSQPPFKVNQPKLSIAESVQTNKAKANRPLLLRTELRTL